MRLANGDLDAEHAVKCAKARATRIDSARAHEERPIRDVLGAEFIGATVACL